MVSRLFIIPIGFLVLSCTSKAPDTRQGKTATVAGSFPVYSQRDAGHVNQDCFTERLPFSFKGAGEKATQSSPAKLKWVKEEEGRCTSWLCPPGKEVDMFRRLNKAEQRLKSDPYSSSEFDSSENSVGFTLPLCGE